MVTYVKLPVYCQDWLRWRYRQPGSPHVSMPFALHPAGRLLYGSLRSNVHLEAWTMLSVCEALMSIPLADLPPEAAHLVPGEAMRRFYCPFEIAPEHWYHGRLVESNRLMQFTHGEAQKFRAIVMDEMWRDLEDFRTGEWHRWARVMGYKESEFSNMLWMWIDDREIDPDNYDAILRVCRRSQQKERARYALQATDPDGTRLGRQKAPRKAEGNLPN